jgi:hypothetical protein
MQGGDSGPAVVPGQPDKSLLIRAVRYQDEHFEMPPTGKLPAAEIALLEEWVRRGAPFPAVAAIAAEQQTVNLAAGRKFWSFQPPRAHEPPPTRDQSAAPHLTSSACRRRRKTWKRSSTTRLLTLTRS